MRSFRRSIFFGEKRLDSVLEKLRESNYLTKKVHKTMKSLIPAL